MRYQTKHVVLCISHNSRERYEVWVIMKIRLKQVEQTLKYLHKIILSLLIKPSNFRITNLLLMWFDYICIM